LAVGWHEHGHAFSQGTTSPELLAKLKGLIEKARIEHSQYNFRGLHHCSLCEQVPNLSPLIDSHINLFIPGQGVIYDATAGTVHYVESHEYLPPSAFIDAIDQCPEYGSEDYYDALRAANRGRVIPLQSKEEEAKERRDFLEELAAKRAQLGK
jgi:hypothetical protein